MSDPLRRDAGASASEAGRESRIEELLLVGLDHYFDGQHELAINVWTRVLFLDRTHVQARAYIERARSAIAERQREGEELLHTGAAAFNRGDAPAARQLLTSAVERGAPAEEALALLDRLDRLAPAVDPPGPWIRSPRRAGRSADAGADRERGFPYGMFAAVLTLVLLAGAGLILVQSGWAGPWHAERAVPAAPSMPELEDPLPVPSASSVGLARARAFEASGRLLDALAALDTIRRGDPLRAEADVLRAAIQRTLLESAHATAIYPGQAADKPDQPDKR